MKQLENKNTKEFKKKLKEKGILSEVTICECLGINGQDRHMVMIENMAFEAPEPIFNYELPDSTIDALAESFSNNYKDKKTLNEIFPNDEKIDFTLKDNIPLKKVIMILVNNDKNERLLKEVPHRPSNLPNISIIYKNVFGCLENDENYSHIITNKYLEETGFTEEDLYRMAVNAKTEPKFISLDALLPDYDDLEISDDNKIYILTNGNLLYGASQIVFDDTIDLIKKKLNSNNFYVIPSSINELLVFKGDNIFVPEMNTSINDVNSRILEPEMYLSDSLYYYNGKYLQIAE